MAVAWFLGDAGLIWLDGLVFGATVLLIVAVWWIVQPNPNELSSPVLLTLLLVTLCSLTVIFVASRASFIQAAAGVVIVGCVYVAGVGTTRFVRVKGDQSDLRTKRQYALVLIVGIVFLLFVLKIPTWKVQPGASRSVIIVAPIAWTGISYLAFRLLAVLLDFRADRLRLEPLSLRDLLVYVLFFPAYTAGPIDRAQRFVPEQNEAKSLTTERFAEGSARIVVGVFKKFVIADTLGLVALNSSTLSHVQSSAGMWVLLYLYAFQIYLDFSGYTDVAIGLGRLYGITLPENFDRPYLQPNIQRFWQRWHITLSTWFRIYYFTPFSRTLMRGQIHIPQWSIVMLSQLTTMILIGLWHGVTVNFVLWGAWHGIGLFSHRLLAENTRNWHKLLYERVWTRRLLYVGSVLTTFHFVTLGWVFFALPTTDESIRVIAGLFGLNS